MGPALEWVGYFPIKGQLEFAILPLLHTNESKTQDTDISPSTNPPSPIKSFNSPLTTLLFFQQYPRSTGNTCISSNRYNSSFGFGFRNLRSP